MLGQCEILRYDDQACKIKTFYVRVAYVLFMFQSKNNYSKFEVLANCSTIDDVSNVYCTVMSGIILFERRGATNYLFKEGEVLWGSFSLQEE